VQPEQRQPTEVMAVLLATGRTRFFYFMFEGKAENSKLNITFAVLAVNLKHSFCRLRNKPANTTRVEQRRRQQRPERFSSTSCSLPKSFERESREKTFSKVFSLETF